MSRILAPLALSALVACVSDYELPGQQPQPAVPNPPVEENPEQLDRIVQVAQPEVDVLFIVDNSCSMYDKQVQLAQNFPTFMNYFIGSGVDFHMGVTSTDMVASTGGNQGRLRAVAGTRYIDAETVNPVQVFSQMTTMGTGGHYDEKGRAAAYTAIELKRDFPANEGFYREEASMHFVFVTDEEDYSASNPVTRQEYINWMRNLKWAPEFSIAHGIYGVPGSGCGEAGNDYRAYITNTGGTQQNLCAQNWTPFLDQLGLQTSGLKREFFLTKMPVVAPWELEVRVRTQLEDNSVVTFDFITCDAEQAAVDETCEVVYNPGRNSITFLYYIPDPFSEILIRYKIRENFAALDSAGQ